MIFGIFFITIFVAFINGQENVFYVFSKSRPLLSQCIENHLLNSSDPYYKEVGTAKDIANLISNRFYERCKKKEKN